MTSEEGIFVAIFVIQILLKTNLKDQCFRIRRFNHETYELSYNIREYVNVKWWKMIYINFWRFSWQWLLFCMSLTKKWPKFSKFAIKYFLFPNHSILVTTLHPASFFEEQSIENETNQSIMNWYLFFCNTNGLAFSNVLVC